MRMTQPTVIANIFKLNTMINMHLIDLQRVFTKNIMVIIELIDVCNYFHIIMS